MRPKHTTYSETILLILLPDSNSKFNGISRTYSVGIASKMLINCNQMLQWVPILIYGAQYRVLLILIQNTTDITVIDYYRIINTGWYFQTFWFPLWLCREDYRPKDRPQTCEESIPEVLIVPRLSPVRG